ncbi:MAG: hypothetical protein HRU20_18105 [Pseudomonadales bacterium]|nr:hypothetical protein [Pseudomonadales bacterium]
MDVILVMPFCVHTTANTVFTDVDTTDIPFTHHVDSHDILVRRIKSNACSASPLQDTTIGIQSSAPPNVA